MQLDASADSCWRLWQAVREKNPLIQCITNFVSMDFMANTLLAVGASPAMAHSYDEIEEFQQVATGLVVNVGTLTSDWVASMQLAAKTANSLGKPWVLDPVGAGATAFRSKTIVSLLKLRPTLIRGNASEIMAVAGAAGATTRGVDSTAAPSDALASGKKLAQEYGCIVGISGADDLITDGKSTVKVSNGDAMMTKITAGGCSVTAVACAFITAAPEQPLLATAFALAVFGISAEVGIEAGAKGPGSLRVEMLDALYSMKEHHIKDNIQVGAYT
ncbi:hypothetical protein WJX82_008765 [Trebouxia sp. C0006]